jgi:Tol biopolymer transport system component
MAALSVVRRWGVGGMVVAWAVLAWGVAASGQATTGAAGSPEWIFVYARLTEVAGNQEGIIAIDPEDGTWHKVTDLGNPTARVSPDGRTIAFVRTERRGRDDKGIWTIPARGGDPVRIIDLVGRPYWSADGRQLLISGTGTLPPRGDRFETWRVNADGTGRAKLPIAETDIVVDWSPDGAWLLVSSNRRPPDGGYPSLFYRPTYAMHPDGTDERLISEGGGVNHSHRFAPDSRTIVYTRFDEKADEASLWAVDVEGKGRRCVLRERDDAGPFQADWSPDGKRLVVVLFDRSRDDQGKKNDVIRQTRLEVIDAEGKAIRSLGVPAAEGLRILGWRRGG